MSRTLSNQTKEFSVSVKWHCYTTSATSVSSNSGLEGTASQICDGDTETYCSVPKVCSKSDNNTWTVIMVKVNSAGWPKGAYPTQLLVRHWGRIWGTFSTAGYYFNCSLGLTTIEKENGKNFGGKPTTKTTATSSQISYSKSTLWEANNRALGDPDIRLENNNYHFAIRICGAGSTEVSDAKNRRLNEVNTKWTYDLTQYQIDVTATTGGSVSLTSDWKVTEGGITYINKTASYTISATPASGYHFVRWDDGSTSPTRTLTASADTTHTATFAKETGGADVYLGTGKIAENVQKVYIGGVEIYHND